MATAGRVTNQPLDAKRSADWFPIVGTKNRGGRTQYVLDHIDAKPIIARRPADHRAPVARCGKLAALESAMTAWNDGWSLRGKRT